MFWKKNYLHKIKTKTKKLKILDRFYDFWLGKQQKYLNKCKSSKYCCYLCFLFKDLLVLY